MGVGEGGGCQGSWGLRGSDAPEDDDTGTHAADEPARRCQSDVLVQWAQLLRSLRWWWSGGARRFQGVAMAPWPDAVRAIAFDGALAPLELFH